jgi:hypothetical protein
MKTIRKKIVPTLYQQKKYNLNNVEEITVNILCINESGIFLTKDTWCKIHGHELYFNISTFNITNKRIKKKRKRRQK